MQKPPVKSGFAPGHRSNRGDIFNYSAPLVVRCQVNFLITETILRLFQVDYPISIILSLNA
jgi:hypothetical protein